VIDPEAYRYVAVNKAAAALYGLPRDEMVSRGMDWSNAAIPGLRSREQLRPLHEEAIRSYPEALRELREFPRVGGGPPLVLETTRRAMQVDGKWLVVSVRRDVTEYQQSIHRLRLLSASINNAPDAILVVDPDAMEYVEVNESCAQMWGMSREEMLRPGAMREVIRRSGWDEEEIRANYAKLIADESRPQTTSIHLTRGGTERVLEAIRRAVRTEGRWLIVSVMRDLEASRAAARKMQQLQEALDVALDPIYVTDPETMEWVHVNKSASRLAGLTPDEMLQRGLRAHIQRVGGPLWTLEELRELFQALIASYPEPRTDVRTVPSPDGTSRVLEFTRRAIRLENIWRIVTVTHDVTERVQAARELELRAEELARSNRELEQFAYVTSHDLSEPLRMIAGFTELLERRYGRELDADGREFIGYIVDGAKRMRKLIDDLLLYSRAARGASEFREHRVDEALDRALANLAVAVSESGAVIERPEALPVLPCDPTGMGQLFQNLVGNALKFRGDTPVVVRISAEREGAMWHFRVEDNGIGIAPAYAERVFVIFQRLHSRDRYEGTGIGLAICKKVVERHGGRIWVESEPGHGARFHFTLPAERKPN
jgi:PAS domain S-box-containing protein